MSGKDYKTILGFTDAWLTLGLVTDESLQQSGAFYETGIDRSTEHYRYGAFRQYLKAHRPLAPSMAEALYALGATDIDGMMGGAMMADIVALPECPDSVTDMALNSGREHLLRLIEWRHLRRELETVGVTPERFQHSLDHPNSSVQCLLLEKTNLSPEQIQALADQGASRTVRNIARNLLRQSKYRQSADHSEP
jgi:hypothetical protein